MIYITSNLNPLPCILVSDETLPPLMLSGVLVVACPTFGFFVLALTAIPINGAATLTAGFRKLFQAVCVPVNKFRSLLFIDPPSN